MCYGVDIKFCNRNIGVGKGKILELLKVDTGGDLCTCSTCGKELRFMTVVLKCA